MKLAVAAACALALVAVHPSDAFADDPGPVESAATKKKPRPSHWGIGFGGFGALTGPADYGPAAEIEFYPGAGFGRYGVRAEYRGFKDFENGFFSVGVAFEAGAARPTLQLSLHVDVGVTYSDALPVLAAGVQWQLWFKPPFGISIDGGGYLIIDGSNNTRLALMQAITLRIAR